MHVLRVLENQLVNILLSRLVVLRDPKDIFVIHISYIGHGIHMWN